CPRGPRPHTIKRRTVKRPGPSPRSIRPMCSTAVRLAFAFVAVVVFVAFVPASLRADYPKPSPYPKAWELKIEHGTPKRVVVQVPNSNTPRAYWYMTYTVTNDTDKEQLFLPAFEMLTEDGR